MKTDFIENIDDKTKRIHLDFLVTVSKQYVSQLQNQMCVHNMVTLNCVVENSFSVFNLVLIEIIIEQLRADSGN